MQGTIKKNPETGKLYIDGTLPTQKHIALREECITKFDLKENDTVQYDGYNYEYVRVYSKLN